MNKTNKEISDILKNLINNEKLIEANIRKIFGIKKIHVSLLFIFDLETQEKNNYQACSFCEQKGINYYMFSYEKNGLYRHNFDENKNEKISIYSPSKKNLSE